MLIAVMSDIHSNFVALEAVLEDIKGYSPDQIVCCGDITGDGAQPLECIELLKENKIESVRGNCDLDYDLDSLPVKLEKDYANFVHGSLFESEQFHYLDNYGAITRDFELMNGVSVLFTGHTHIPVFYMYQAENLYKINDKKIALKQSNKYIINPGSVGQPRDRDSRASYALYDVEKQEIKIRRIGYDIKLAQYKIREVGLPEIAASRLEQGW